MIRWFAARMVARWEHRAIEAKHNWAEARTGLDQLDWERDHQRCIRRIEWWSEWL